MRKLIQIGLLENLISFNFFLLFCLSLKSLSLSVSKTTLVLIKVRTEERKNCRSVFRTTMSCQTRRRRKPTFCNCTGIFIEASNYGNMTRPGFCGRPSMRNPPTTLSFDYAPEKRRSVIPFRVKLEKLVSAQTISYVPI